MSSNNPDLNQIAINQVISRYSFLVVLRAALDAKSNKFAREISQDWVKNYPGDLEVNYLLCKALLSEGDKKQATAILKTICRRDPEFYEAMEALALTSDGSEDVQLEPLVAINALGELPKAPASMPKWGADFAKAWNIFKEGKLDDALALNAPILQGHPDFLLGAVLQLRILTAKKDENSLFQQATVFHQKWKDCVVISLLLAESKMSVGQESEAVSLLHECVANDAAGQVARRVWGAGHPYTPLWGDSFDFKFSYSVPAQVAELFGWNYLPAGQAVSGKKAGKSGDAQASDASQVNGSGAQGQSVTEATADGSVTESLRSVEEAFNALASRFIGTTYNRDEGRFPEYVVMSCRGGLVKQYGQQTALVIESAMKQLAAAVGSRKGWGGMVYIVDDPNVRTQWGINPVDAIDPWKIKLAIKDLDTALTRKGEMIGALVIVGGADVVPFHKLPNPTDDDDKEVPSDNPYSTLDNNYFVPGWPVGRLPGESGTDSALLLGQIHRMIEYHTRLQRLTSAPSLIEIIFRLLDRFNAGMKKVKKIKASNFGITAAVWRKASLNVFNPIGTTGDLLICPPDQNGTFQTSRITDAGLAFANLHGTADGPDWYGQRDNQLSPEGVDYPIAINPSMLQDSSSSPQVVFSEACYGANIIDKKEDESMALKFMGVGCKAFVGSTTIAYGAVDTPLIGADIIGNNFWKALKDGSTAGEAFIRAKVELAQEMSKRQGFLDGEDQKTLISFVLYGDPLVVMDLTQKVKKGFRTLKQLPYRTFSDLKNEDNPGRPITQEQLSAIKDMVNGYLPGSEDADMVFRAQYDPLASQNEELGVEDDGKMVKMPEGHIKINFSKSVRTASRTHRHFARATVNQEGKMIKLVVSR